MLFLPSRSNLSMNKVDADALPDAQRRNGRNKEPRSKPMPRILRTKDASVLGKSNTDTKTS